MLSGNCSVNAEIITFNAPIKQKQRLRPPSISAFVHTQQELDQSAVGKRKTEVCSLQSTVFSLKAENRKQRKVGDQPATTRHLGLGQQSTGGPNVRLNEIVCGLSMQRPSLHTEKNEGSSFLALKYH